MGMTTKEAIKVLRTESVELGGSVPSVCRFLEALDMAVKALEDVTDKDVGKMTNADRIRAMSDEELVVVMYHPFCDKRTDKECKAFGDCNQCALEWLQQPAGEEDKHENLD